jgi:hypothetical protein
MTSAQVKETGRFRQWFLEGMHPPESTHDTAHHTHPWWQVMCLTGVDYFSTLGYQPGIAFLAAGALSPIATLVLVMVTLFGALPMYNRVAAASPHGQGSISMLEHLLSRWKGKALVLALLGFAMTGFVITITLSAADATAHIVENPLAPLWFHHKLAVTFFLLLLLGAVLLKGFKEAMGIAVVIVAVYLLLNAIVIGRGLIDIFSHPEALSNWKTALMAGESGGNPLMIALLAVIAFPRLALGLSGFETGVAVMPLVKGDPTDTEEHPAGRIRNTRKLLATAAIIMSVMLIGSSLVTALLIPAEAFQHGGEAYGRALSYLAHEFFGEIFGTVYDVSTIVILWFAGASALAGLLTLVPRYLPRYGMAPDWARATRPLVVVITVIALVVTWLFDADVERQAGAYATGVLGLMTSGAVAVTLLLWRGGWIKWFYLGVTLVFVYAIAVNIFERPEGIKIAFFFIVAIVAVSLVSRISRATELRISQVVLNENAQRFLEEAARDGVLDFVANQPECNSVEEYEQKGCGTLGEYEEKEQSARARHRIPADTRLLILEMYIDDASEFSDVLEVSGVEVGKYRVLRCSAQAVPNGIAAFLIHAEKATGVRPTIYFEWSEGNPVYHAMRFIVFGVGDVAPVTREVLRKAIPNPALRPQVSIG